MGGHAPAATAADPVSVPGFFDPHRHVDRPEIEPGRVIRFLTTDDHPPFNYLAADGTLAGFNVDLVRAICRVLEVACSLQARSFDGLEPALASGAGDAVAASVAITAASRARLDFSWTTMRLPARFAARRDRPAAPVLPETVGRLVIGVQAGTAHEAFLRQFFPQAVVQSFSDPEALRAALAGGRVDLMFADGLATALWLGGSASNACCRFAGGPFTEPRFFGEGTAIALRKGDQTLVQAMNWALQRLSAEGILADLYLKHVPLGFY